MSEADDIPEELKAYIGEIAKQHGAEGKITLIKIPPGGEIRQLLEHTIELENKMGKLTDCLHGQATLLSYLLHRLGGSIIIDQDPCISAYQEFDVCYRTDSGIGGKVQMYLRVRQEKRQ